MKTSASRFNAISKKQLVYITGGNQAVAPIKKPHVTRLQLTDKQQAQTIQT